MLEGKPNPISPTWSRSVEGPAMRAFVVGVAGYPSAKEGQGIIYNLDVPDIPCAASAARRMADWLYVNRDALTPKLASIHLLVTDGEADYLRIPYPFQDFPGGPVHPASSDAVERAGEDWVDSFQEGDSAFCFISGHGAVRANDAVVFLDDLNSDKRDPWGSHINVTEVARAFKAHQSVRAAYFFVDACQEFSKDFALSNTESIRIIRPLEQDQLKYAREKVLLISAASAGMFAYEGDWPEDRKNPLHPSVTIGRFTQVLIDALDGASARFDDVKWVVDTGKWKLHTDLKYLYGRRVTWITEPFEPVLLIDQNNYFPLVVPPNPRIPIFVLTDPERLMPSYRFHVHDANGIPLKSCPLNHPSTWMFDISPNPHYLIADNGTGQPRQYELKPSGPIFDKRIPVA
jgi:hypothetical protein